MRTATQPRVPPGVPTGGRFTITGHDESAISLADATLVALQEVLRGTGSRPARRVALVSGNYVPAVAVRAAPIRGTPTAAPRGGVRIS